MTISIQWHQIKPKSETSQSRPGSNGLDRTEFDRTSIDIWTWGSVLNPLVALSSKTVYTYRVNDNILNKKLEVRNPWCCEFWPAFRCCVHSKAGRTTFFSRFQRTPSGSQPVFACWPALKSRQKWKKHVFSFIFRRFFLISNVKSLKKV